eukprot:COSAG06_NODE_43893_length_368_cov_0.587361_2_plen_40_part_01
MPPRALGATAIESKTSRYSRWIYHTSNRGWYYLIALESVC